MGESADTAPTVGRQSARVLGNEILKYLKYHKTAWLLHIHALRAGDGMTVARSLGNVHGHYYSQDSGDEDEERRAKPPVFSLDLYPSPRQRGIAGKFIADARDKRRTGAGVLAAEDRWMLESSNRPGGVNMPRLRWAIKEQRDPATAAHLALAFDTFESRVVAGDGEGQAPATRPYHAFGLLSFYERQYTSRPSPLWVSAIPPAARGEKHPSRRAHTDTLVRLQNAVQDAVARHVHADNQPPILKTEISRDKAESLKELHRLCDWVVTLDRNAGIEYFDSPRDDRDVYDAYVIDCVPEREDLGCLQLITSTANLDEVRNLLDHALDQMGLSRSRRNAEFLMEDLKALSGRLAIRLTGHQPATSELIALAISHAHCGRASPGDDCWVSLKDGFIVPVDDVRDLLPPLAGEKGEVEKRTRPDLVYVSTVPRRGLIFRFVEVKYRRHLRAARSPDVLRRINEQTQALRRRWDRWYGHEECAAFRAIRRAKLARILRFYADKAHRHHLSTKRHAELVSEVTRMVEKGGAYAFAAVAGGDRGWVFCPEYAGHRPLKISPEDWNTQVFLFGPGLLPDTDVGSETVLPETSDTKSRRRSPKTRKQPGGDSKSRRKKDDNKSVGHAETSAAATYPAAPTVCFGTDTLTNTEVCWPLAVQGNPHLLIAGLPGMGKTTCLLNLCRQMIEADIRPIVFSYHQDIDERLVQSVGSVRFIDFDGLGFNPLQVIDRESRMPHLDVAGAMRDIFTAIYPELGDIQADRIRKAVKDSFVEAGWDAGAIPSDMAEPTFRRFFEILCDEPRPDRGLRSLLARLEELDDYGFFNLRKSHSSLWESRRPTVIRIHTTQNDNLQRAFASLVFYGLYKDMFRRGIQDRITHALIFDEAHRAARLNLIPKMAKECRKYGISLVLASQEARDFNVSVFSAIANYLILRLTDADAKFLVRNVSNSRQERMLIDRIKLMEKFKALYFTEGKSRPYPVDLSP